MDVKEAKRTLNASPRSDLTSVKHQYIDATSRKGLNVGNSRLPFGATESTLNSGEVVKVQRWTVQPVLQLDLG